jgi:hypothetical protein
LARFRPLAFGVLGPLAACLALAPIALCFGTAPGSLAAYLGYVLLYDLLPGTLVWQQMRSREDGRDVSLSAGWVVGLCLEVTVHDLSDRLGLPRAAYLYAWPVIVVASSATVAALGRRPTPVKTPIRDWASPVLFAVAAGAVLLVAIGAFTPAIDFHFAEQALIANAIQAGPPYEYPVVQGSPLFYNYLIHTHVAAASAVTGIPTLELVSRSVPFTLTILCLLAALSLGLEQYGDKRVPILVIAQVFGVIGAIQGQRIQTGFFGSGIPGATVFVLSSLAAFAIFFTLTSAYMRLCREESLSIAGLGLIALLLWSASGTRLPALVGFGAGVLADLLTPGTTASRRTRACLVLGLAGLALITSLSAFYGLGSQLAGTKFMELAAGPAESLREIESFRVFHGWGVPKQAAGLLAFVLIVFGQATFLTGGAIWLWRRRELFRHELDAFWIGVLLCGAFFLGATYAGGGSHFTFMHYGHFALSFLGARGLLLFLDRRERSPGAAALAAFAIGMAALQYGETAHAVTVSVGDLRVRRTKPSLVTGEDYASLIDRLNGPAGARCPAVAVGEWNGPGNALPAEVPQLHMLGTETTLRRFLARYRDLELERRRALITAVSQVVSEDSGGLAGLQRAKQESGVGGCVLVLVAYPSADLVSRKVDRRLRDGSFAGFREGRFVGVWLD